MHREHGASTIRQFMEDLMELARSGEQLETSAGAEPHRSYAYLEFHRGKDEHSLLLLRTVVRDGKPEVEAHRLDGDGEQVKQHMDELVG